MSTNLLDLNELNKVEEPYSRSKNIKSYEYILEQCHNKIKQTNNVNRAKQCYYKPPVFLVGKPMYNYYDLINYLIESLTNNGIYSTITDQGIFICWDQKVLNYIKYQQELTKIKINPKLNNYTGNEALKSNPENLITKPKNKPANKLTNKTRQSKAKSTNRNKNTTVNMILMENDQFPINLDVFKADSYVV